MEHHHNQALESLYIFPINHYTLRNVFFHCYRNITNIAIICINSVAMNDFILTTLEQGVHCQTC